MNIFKIYFKQIFHEFWTNTNKLGFSFLEYIMNKMVISYILLPDNYLLKSLVSGITYF